MSPEPIVINAAAGGQVFRTAIGLCALLQKPVRIENIRQNRPNPGLQAQHLMALKTVQQLCQARVSGNALYSQMVLFEPQAPVSAQLSVNIGTAGSSGLLLQSVFFPSLLTENHVRVLGGTNVPFAPPVEFLQHALLPVLKEMGCRFEIACTKHGFFPKGGGSVSFSSRPAKQPLRSLVLAELGELEAVEIFSACSSLPSEVANRQVAAAKKTLRDLNTVFFVQVNCKEQSVSVGSSVVLLARFSSGRVLSGSALGKKGVLAEQVGKEAAMQLLKQIRAQKTVDEFLADQLVPFVALAKGKSVLDCGKISEHVLENIAVCEQLLGVSFEVVGKKGGPGEIFVKGGAFKGV